MGLGNSRSIAPMTNPRLNLKTASNKEIEAWLEQYFIIDRYVQQMLNCLNDSTLVVKRKEYFISTVGLCLDIDFYDPKSQSFTNQLCPLQQK